MGLPASNQLVMKWGHAEGLACMAGPKNRLTVVDIDWPRERLQQARRRAIVEGWIVQIRKPARGWPPCIGGDRPLKAYGIPYPILSRHPPPSPLLAPESKKEKESSVAESRFGHPCGAP